MKKISIWILSICTLLIMFNSCDEVEELDECPEVSIDITNVSGSAVYRFVAKIDVTQDVELIWSVDGETVNSGNLNDVSGQILDYRFESGDHTVCVAVVSENCQIEVCKDIFVERDETDPCPDLFFEARQYEIPSQYKFIADFENINEVSYEWLINGEFVDGSAPNEGNYLIHDFDTPGIYEVCIASETPECPEGVKYCKVIEVVEVDQDCLELSFTKELEPGTDAVYVFEAEVEQSVQIVELQWYVNGELTENSFSDNDRVLVYQFDSGTYEVCLKAFTENCTDGVIYCKNFTVGGDACPEIFFEAEQDGENLAYYFYPNAFTKIENTTITWIVNEDVIGTTMGHDNPFYYQFSSGQYKVCMFVETPNCPEGVQFCKDIKIEDTTGCPNLFFGMQQEGDTPGYNFYADFDGIDTTSFEWTINGDVVDREIVNSAEKDNYLYYQLGAGTYEICIFAETPDCPRGTSYCKTLVIE